jgi:RNA polymerase sigma factor FliA
VTPIRKPPAPLGGQLAAEDPFLVSPSETRGDAVGSLPTKVLQAKANEAYAAQSRETHEKEWILGHLSLVHHVVQKIAASLARKVDYDDLVSAGTLGLVKAAKAFDPGRHAEFSTYAYIRIRGAVFDELRSRTFAPPAVNRSMRKVREAYSAFLASNGRPPEDEELAAQLGVPVTRLYHTLEDARRQHFLSIHGLAEDQPALGEILTADEDESPEPTALRHELLDRVTRAIQSLPERDRDLVVLYYQQDLTMKEIAAVLGVTESRVSQMHAAALFHLSMKLGNVQ